jgi:hypothetical protein
MLLAFQVLLFVFILLFGIGAMGDADKHNRLNFSCITMASILGFVATLFVN